MAENSIVPKTAGFTEITRILQEQVNTFESEKRRIASIIERIEDNEQVRAKGNTNADKRFYSFKQLLRNEEYMRYLQEYYAVDRAINQHYMRITRLNELMRQC